MSPEGGRKPAHQAAHRAAGRPSGRSVPRPGGRRSGHHQAAHRGTKAPPVRRLPVIALVLALLVGGGIASAMTAEPSAEPFHPPSAALAALAAPAASNASSWYCTGGTGPKNPIAQATLYLVNSSTQAVSGTITVSNGLGKSASEQVGVPPLGEVTVSPGSLLSGDWLASRVDLQGGGVAVSELLAGPTGWSIAPCSSVAAPDWYFASGSTDVGNLLFVSLFNPTPSESVVDLRFVTKGGVVRPTPFQGLIVDPGRVVTAQVPAFVQNQPLVATEAIARSGRVVATELQVHVAAGQSGMSLRLGSPQPAARWYLPRSSNPPKGKTRLVVFNPAKKATHAVVAIRLPTGSTAPIEQTVPPRSIWTLDLSKQTRIPSSTDYAVSVTTSGGRGVVVDRVTVAPTGAPAPQWGAVTALDGATAASPSGWWSLPNPALDAAHVEPGAQATTVALLNPGARTVRATIAPLGTGRGPRGGGRTVRIGPHDVVEVATSSLHSFGTAPIGVKADLPVAVIEDVTPAGAVGTVTADGVPQS